MFPNSYYGWGNGCRWPSEAFVHVVFSCSFFLDVEYFYLEDYLEDFLEDLYSNDVDGVDEATKTATMDQQQVASSLTGNQSDDRDWAAKITPIQQLTVDPDIVEGLEGRIVNRRLVDLIPLENKGKKK